MGTSGLGALLVREGLLSEQDRRTIGRTCGQSSWAFAKCVLAMGMLDEDELAAFFAERTKYQVAPRNLLDQIDRGVLDRVDSRMIARLEVLPIRCEEDRIRLAVADPLDKSTLRQIEFFTGMEAQPLIAPLSQIYAGLKHLVPDFKPQFTALSQFLQNHASTAWQRQRIEEEIDFDESGLLQAQETQTPQVGASSVENDNLADESLEDLYDEDLEEEDLAVDLEDDDDLSPATNISDEAENGDELADVNHADELRMAADELAADDKLPSLDEVGDERPSPEEPVALENAAQQDEPNPLDKLDFDEGEGKLPADEDLSKDQIEEQVHDSNELNLEDEFTADQDDESSSHDDELTGLDELSPYDDSQPGATPSEQEISGNAPEEPAISDDISDDDLFGGSAQESPAIDEVTAKTPESPIALDDDLSMTDDSGGEDILDERPQTSSKNDGFFQDLEHQTTSGTPILEESDDLLDEIAGPPTKKGRTSETEEPVFNLHTDREVFGDYDESDNGNELIMQTQPIKSLDKKSEPHSRLSGEDILGDNELSNEVDHHATTSLSPLHDPASEDDEDSDFDTEESSFTPLGDRLDEDNPILTQEDDPIDVALSHENSGPSVTSLETDDLDFDEPALDLPESQAVVRPSDHAITLLNQAMFQLSLTQDKKTALTTAIKAFDALIPAGFLLHIDGDQGACQVIWQKAVSSKGATLVGSKSLLAVSKAFQPSRLKKNRQWQSYALAQDLAEIIGVRKKARSYAIAQPELGSLVLVTALSEPQATAIEAPAKALMDQLSRKILLG